MSHKQDDNDTLHTSNPPDQGSAGDVSTTGHSSHDVGGGDADAQGGHGGGHGGHGDDAGDVSTLVPTRLSQLILPAIILVFVAILVAGPIGRAFAPQPAAPPTTEERGTSGTGTESGAGAEGAATPLQSENKVATAGATVLSTATARPPSAATTAPTTSSAASTPGAGTPAADLGSVATRTAVAVAGELGEVARVPVRLTIGGASFAVKPGSGLLPDWKPSQEAGTATWIEGTVANHVLYIPYDSGSQTLFQTAKPGDPVKLQMNTGQLFSFVVTRAERAVNGPPTKEGQFSVGVAMSQDHAGVTLFLTGDPAADRAVVQADFTGDIQ